MPKWRWWLRTLVRQIWFRATIISLISVAGALLSAAIAPLIPYELSLKIGGKAVDNVLGILASSMLAVTAFSMTAMVAAYSGAAQNVTPRATRLLIEDPTAQNALSTFLGAFLFSIIGIIALSTGIYGDQGRAVLFIMSIAMVVWIAVTLLRWIHVLTYFGRVPDTIQRVEKAGLRAIGQYPGAVTPRGHPNLGTPEAGHAICGDWTGYVQLIDIEALCEAARSHGHKLHIAAPPGRFVDPRTPLIWSLERPSDHEREAIIGCFTIETERTFDHDPRYSMVVLSEIASRALSPGINDPGTAISSLSSAQRIIEALKGHHEGVCDGDDDIVAYPPISIEEMVEDLVLPMARDGAGLAEVGVRLQRMLGAIADAYPDAAEPMKRMADDAVGRAKKALSALSDLDRVTRAHERAFSDK